MQEKQLFEYAVVRVVPKVEREEFLNVGVVLYCARHKFLRFMYVLDQPRLLAFSHDLDIAEISEYLQSFDRICNGGEDAGPIGKLTMAERFRWLTATRSTIVQSSKVHTGLCDNAPEMLSILYHQLVR